MTQYIDGYVAGTLPDCDIMPRRGYVQHGASQTPSRQMVEDMRGSISRKLRTVPLSEHFWILRLTVVDGIPTFVVGNWFDDAEDPYGLAPPPPVPERFKELFGLADQIRRRYRLITLEGSTSKFFQECVNDL